MGLQQNGGYDMFYKTILKDHIRVPPRLFSDDINEAVVRSIRQKFDGYIDPEIGIVVDISSVKEVGEGVIIAGDGAAYYNTTFEAITFKPEMQEVVVGKIKDIADFGAFVSIGPIEGMVHISQAMDDYVSFAKDKVLTGKETGRSLKVGDKVRARIIAVSYKDVSNPKIGLTMRQPGLGKLEWEDDGETTPAPAKSAPKKKEEKKGK